MIAFAFAALLTLAPPPQLPFSVEASEDVSANFPGAPHVESASFAQWKGHWVFIGGRIAGYHALGGGSADFPRVDANRDVWVVDTNVSPARTYHLAVSQLPVTLSAVKDEWQSTGQLYYQDGSSLYIAGGYGEASTGQWMTYPIISKINLPLLIEGVVKGSFVAKSVEFTTSPLVQSAGGALSKLTDGCFYVVMGHVFTGTYTAFEGQGEHNSPPVSQTYLNEIRKLRITSAADGRLSIQAVATFRDEKEFHRRDLNVAPFLSDKGLGLAVYGGVFTPETQLSYGSPVYIVPGEPPVVDSSFDQKTNNYDCAKLLIYSSSEKTMSTTFFGGISHFNWDFNTQAFIENPRTGSKTHGNYMDGLQWTDQISTVRRVSETGNEATSQTVQDTSLPGFIGTGAVFIPLESISRASAGTDILSYEALSGKRTLVGYIYGGIRAFPFRFPYNKSSLPYNSGTVPTKPSELVIKVYVISAQ